MNGSICLLLVFWQLLEEHDHVHQCCPVCTICKGCWQFLQHQLQDAQHCNNVLAYSTSTAEQYMLAMCRWIGCDYDSAC